MQGSGAQSTEAGQGDLREGRLPSQTINRTSSSTFLRRATEADGRLGACSEIDESFSPAIFVYGMAFVLGVGKACTLLIWRTLPKPRPGLQHEVRKAWQRRTPRKSAQVEDELAHKRDSDTSEHRAPGDTIQHDCVRVLRRGDRAHGRSVTVAAVAGVMNVSHGGALAGQANPLNCRRFSRTALFDAGRCLGLALETPVR